MLKIMLPAAVLTAGVSTLFAYQPQSVDPATLPDSDGKALLTSMCSSCHALTEVTQARHTPKEWSDVVDDMISRGMMASDEDIKKIASYLAANVGRVNVNHASAEDLKAALELSDAESAAIVKARADGATFQTLDDLKKVPGVDAKKIDDHRAEIFFADR